MKMFLIAFFCFCLGAIFGVVTMCLFQIGKDERLEELYRSSDCENE